MAGKGKTPTQTDASTMNREERGGRWTGQGKRMMGRGLETHLSQALLGKFFLFSSLKKITNFFHIRTALMPHPHYICTRQQPQGSRCVKHVLSLWYIIFFSFFSILFSTKYLFTARTTVMTTNGHHTPTPVLK